jgi:hypothetical protein
MISYDPVVISHLVACAIQSKALHELAHELEELEFNEETCIALLQILDGRHDLAPFEHALQGENLLALDAIQHAFSDDGRGGGNLLPSTNDPLQPLPGWPNAEKWLNAALGRFVLASRMDVVRNMQAYFDAAIESSHCPPRDLKDANAAMNEIFNQAREGNDPFTELLGGAIHKSVETAARSKQMLQCVRVMIGIELFRSRNGRCPEALDELMPSVFSELPLDPFCGGPFIYRRVENDPHGRQYLLYSTGLDQVDDGGVEYIDPDTGHPSFAPLRDPNLQGYDHFIFRPRGYTPGTSIDLPSHE